MEAALRSKPARKASAAAPLQQNPKKQRTKQAAPSAVAQASSENAPPPSTADDAAFWRNQFLQLKELRETAPERHLKAYRAEVTEQEAAVRAMVSSLRDTLALDPAAAAEASTQEMLGELQAKVAKQRDLIKSFEQLTGCVVKAERELGGGAGGAEEGGGAGGATVAHCVAVNKVHKKAVKFDVTFQGGGEDARYEPTGNKHVLSEELQGKVKLDPLQVPMLLQKVLASLYTEQG